MRHRLPATHRWRQVLQEQHAREHEERAAVTVPLKRQPQLLQQQQLPLLVEARLQQALWQHQEEGVAFLAARESAAPGGGGGFYLDDMRLGKTRTLLAHVLRSLQARLAAGEPRFAGEPTLIVVPKSLVATWLREHAALFGSTEQPLRLVLMAAKVAAGDTPVRLVDADVSAHALAAQADVVLTTYSTLVSASRSSRGGGGGKYGALLALHWRRVIADEAHVFCGTSSSPQKSAATYRVMTHGLRADAKWFVSATPIQNNAQELERARQFVGAAAGADLRPLTLRRERAAVAGDEGIRDVALPWATAAEARLYLALAGRLLARGIEVRDITRLRQLCVSAWLLPADLRDALATTAHVSTAAELPAALTKEQYVLDYVRDLLPQGAGAAGGEKLVVFSSFVQELQRLSGLLAAAGVVHVLVHGTGMAPEAREAALARFAADAAVRVLLITTNMGAFGLDLTAANHAILLDPWWNPYKEAQAMGRLQGARQRRPLRLQRVIVAGTFENYVVQLANGKRALTAERLPTDRVVSLGPAGDERPLMDLLAQFLREQV